MELAGLVLIVVVALTFDFTNGFHDAANAIATSISTRALTPRAALALAAIMNFIGALLGTGVAVTVGQDIVETPASEGGLIVVGAAVAGAILWNLLTWYYGLPSSSTHALIGGLVGATLAAATAVLAGALVSGGLAGLWSAMTERSGVHWGGVGGKVVIPMIVSPLIGVTLGYLMHVAILWTFRRGSPGRINRGFRIAQSVSAAAMALGHGLQDAQKTMGVIVLALVTVGYQEGFGVPLWVIAAVAAAMALGTYAGGWRIIRTLGRRVVHLDPPRGFAAETTAASVLYATAFFWEAPISTTHTITSTILGVGATRRLSAVRWGVARTIVAAWILTFPGAALLAGSLYFLMMLIR
jgi:PiT family inorganic phosphate transporter